MKLRKWQQECLSLANKLYQTQKHFFCLATPGAGKTVFAAALAKSKLETGEVDFVLCFSPSREVNRGIIATFERILEKPMNGRLGAIGCVQTYQSMPTLPASFWEVIRNHKVMVILDEVHHLRGHNTEIANAWGQEVLLNIQEQAEFTLALSGTPWRSDKAPISLARFTEPDNTIHCDYIYGLKEAINDGVCRIPQIALIDNDKISCEQQQEQSTFNSFNDLLSKSDVAYQSLIEQPKLINYMLEQANQKLDELRCTSGNAAGLVVASSIEHAQYIAKRLTNDFQCSTEIVHSKQTDAHARIQQFKTNKTKCIVSVGMISEGTDIPRLQVCCHLSHIRTEMHYRQLLGRILRKQTSQQEFAWLFTLNHWQLAKFAARINIDLPDFEVIFDVPKDESVQGGKKDREILSSIVNDSLVDFNGEMLLGDNSSKMLAGFQSATERHLFSLSESFRQRVISLFV